jgi:hypothetical protein
MPSDRYIDLTLGASGATYTAPANGWIALSKNAGINNANITLMNNNNGLTVTLHVPNSGNYCRGFIPAKKGDEITVIYNATGTTSMFRFIYAEGEN